MLTLAEYLRELKLMAQQYGQEEDLYPLIYMVLWKKFGDLSVRVVEDAGHGEEKLKNFFSGEEYNTRPDMVVLARDFDKNFNKDNPPVDKRYGCIEVKTFVSAHDKIWKLLDAIKNKDANEENKCLELKYIPKAYVYYKKKNVKNLRNAEVKILELKEQIYNDNLLEDYKKAKKMKLSDIKKILKKYAIDSKKMEDAWDGVETYLRIDKVLHVNGLSHKDITEFVSELRWYGKVLYTNGLRWNYIKLLAEKENGTKLSVNCIEIDNLKDIFDAIQAISSVDEVKAKVDSNTVWQKRWEQLNKRLKLIDWIGANNSSKFIL